jgi:hypothetical protein
MRLWVSFAIGFVVLSVAGFVMSRLTGRGRLDVGPVSDSWLAEKRAETFDPANGVR